MSELSGEALKQAATTSMIEGGDIRSRVRDLTLNALRHRRLNAEEVRQVMRALTEGVSLGAEQSKHDMSETLAQAMAGLDDALLKAVQASHLALQQLTTQGKEFGENDLKAALANLKKVEEDFLATINEVAEKGGIRAKSELKSLAEHARRAGTDTGRQVASSRSAAPASHARGRRPACLSRVN
ncbi:MAG: DUF6781 family protein [Pseudomonadota bacterium]